jgi:O-antigen/teichoic acid export membrane protein
MGYSSHTFKGISWMGLLRISTRGVAFVRLAILARILSPTQFGVFGVATLVLAFLEVITETGINVFLIQKKDESNEYISSAWVISIARGCLISLVIVISAPFIARFFNSAESQSLLYLIAVVPFVRGFINPSIINIQKDIQFHKEFYLRTLLLIVDASVAIIVAFITKSAVSLAYGLIISAIIEVVLSFVLFKPRPGFSFEFPKIRHIGARGSWITLTGIFAYLSENLDNILVGRIMGTQFLGIYQNAYKISTLTISEIAEAVNKVTFPVYSKLSDDKIRLKNAFSKVILTSSGLTIALGIFIFIFAEQIVLIILGQNWLSAVPVVKILSIYGILRTILGNIPALLLSLEKQKIVAGIVFIRLFSLAILIVPLIEKFGMIGAGYAMLLSVIIEAPFMAYAAHKYLKNEGS